MEIENTIKYALNIRKGEGSTVSLLLLYSFFLGLGLSFFFATANILFLSKNQGTGSLPYIYITTAVVLLVVDIGYMRLEKIAPISKLLTLVLTVIMASIVVFNLALSGGANAYWLTFALMVWYKAIALATNSEFGKVSALLFDIRQSKRLFGLIGSAEIPSKIAGMLASSFLIHYMETQDLLYCSFFGFFMAFVCFQMLATQQKEKLGVLLHDEESANQQQLQAEKKTLGSKQDFLIQKIFKGRYIFLLCVHTLLAVLMMLFIDYQFLSQVESTYSAEKEIAFFLTIFFSIGEGITFVTKSFFSGRIMNRYGLKIALSILPAGLLVLTVATVFSEVSSSQKLFMYLVGFTMLYSEIVRSSIADPAFFTLFQTLETKMRIDGFNIVGLVENTSYAVAGLVLLAINAVSTHPDIQAGPLFSFILLFIVGSSLFVIRKVDKAYLVALESAIKNRSLEGNIVSLKDAATLNTLTKKLDSEHTGEVLYAVSLILKFDRENLAEYLPKLIAHPSKEVRLEVLKVIETEKTVEVLHIIKLMVSQEADEQVKGYAVRAYCSIHAGDFFEEITPLLNSSSNLIKMSAMIGLIRYGGINGVIIAGQQLIELVKSPESNERAFASHIVGEIGIQNFYHPLLALLKDDSVEVVKAALTASGKIKNPMLLQDTIRLLSSPKVFEASGRALIHFGKEAYPAFEEEFKRSTYDSMRLRRICHICGRVGGRESIFFLKNKVFIKNSEIRNQLLHSLSVCEYTAEKSEHQIIIAQIQIEIREAAFLMAMLVSMENDEALLIMQKALHLELQRSSKRVLLLLSYIYESKAIRLVSTNFFMDSKERKANCLEILDVVLTRELRQMVFPLLEDISIAEKLHALSAMANPIEDEQTDAMLRQMVESKDLLVNEWTKAAAIYMLSDFPTKETIDALIPHTESPNKLIRETAVWSLRKIHEKSAEAGQDTLALGFSPQITDMINTENKKRLLTIEKVLVLKSNSVFSETSEDVLVEVASIVEEEEIKAGETIFYKGDVGTCMYIIYEGHVKVHDGNQTFVEFRDRDFFGELALLDPEPRSASVTAIKDTYLLKIDQETFYEIMADRIEVVRGIIKILCRRLRGMNISMTDMRRKVEQTKAEQTKVENT